MSHTDWITARRDALSTDARQAFQDLCAIGYTAGLALRWAEALDKLPEHARESYRYERSCQLADRRGGRPDDAIRRAQRIAEAGARLEARP